MCALLSAYGTARADDHVLLPPKLSQFVEATDPRGDTGSERATVELEISVDREGKVSDVRVARSGGDLLDEAAVTAARSFVFEPATRDGTPIPAKIRYEYVFAARTPAPPPEAAPTPGVPQKPAALEIIALDHDDNNPLAGAAVVVTTQDGNVLRAVADSKGVFRMEDVPAGTVHVVISKDGYVSAQLDETLEPGMATQAKLRLDKTPDPEAFTATARVDAPPREVTKRTLTGQETKSLAGTRGDPLRAIELLPGVSRNSSGSNPILRGANPQDSQVFLEGGPVPILYHLGGLTSFVHSRVIDTVDVYPSNFSVRYGRKLGGVVDVHLRDPRTDKLHGIADASLIDSSLLLESPIGDNVAVLGAIRRSNIDAVLNAAANSADLAITAAPVYWDYQTIATWKPTDQDRFRIMAFGSSDRFALILKKPADADPAIRGAFDTLSVFHRVQVGYRHRWAKGSEQNTELTYGWLVDKGQYGTLGRSHFTMNTLQGRSEWTGVVSPAFRITAGVDLLGTYFDGYYEGIPPTPLEGDQPMTVSGQKHVFIDVARWTMTPGAYVEAGIRPVPRVLLTPGVRADWNDLVKKGSIDPRFSGRWDITDKTAVKGGVGIFSQAPLERDSVEPIGNPNMDFAHAVHASVGVEQAITDELSTSVEGFSKWLWNMETGTPDGQAPFFVSNQNGRIFGGEFMLRMRPSGRFFGFVSYTLMRSERKDPDKDWRLFDRDQTHILSAAGSYRLGRGWELGASFRYTSGTPFTPVVGSSYNASTDTYSSRLGASMSDRNPAFMRLDARVEKKWTFSQWSLAVYLDVQNVLNSPNRDGFSYNYDYSQRQGARGLPIFPALGIRGEL